MNFPRTTALIVAVQLLCFTLVTSSNARAGGRFVVTTGKVFTVAVWIAKPGLGEALSKALTERPKSKGSNGRVVLRSRAGNTVVVLNRWSDRAAAQDYAVPYIPTAEVYWRRNFSVAGLAPEDSKELVILRSSSVQWSEFLMRDPNKLTELSETVTAMVGTMAAGGAESLAKVARLHASNSSSIGLLALWTTEEGFEVFQKEQTFGDEPYWSAFADNAHWMMSVVQID